MAKIDITDLEKSKEAPVLAMQTYFWKNPMIFVGSMVLLLLLILAPVIVLSITNHNSLMMLMNGDTSTKVGDLSFQIGDLASQIGDMTSQIGDLTSQIGDLTSQIGDSTSLNGEIITHIGNLTSQIGDLISLNEDSTLQIGNLTSLSGDMTTQSNGKSSLCSDLPYPKIHYDLPKWYLDDLGLPGWHEINGSCYYFNVNTQTIQEAKDFCHELDARIFEPRSHNINKEISFKITQKLMLGFWIGLVRSPGTDKWNWMSDNSTVSRDNFWERYPSSNTKYCAIDALDPDYYYGSKYGKSKWYYCSCTPLDKYYVVCEKSLSE